MIKTIAVAVFSVFALAAVPSVYAQSGDVRQLKTRLAALTGLLPEQVTVEVLSHNSDLEESARHLFGAMRRLDGCGAGLLLAEPCHRKEGLGAAIQDRLSRACVRKL